MATVLSKSPPTYNGNDVPRTVRSVVEYLRYLHENMDYLIGQLKKKDTETEATISSMKETLSSMQSAISSIEQEIGTIESNYMALEARVAALENAP